VRIERVTLRRRTIAALTSVVVAVFPCALAAQEQGSWLERLGIDKLRFSGLGAQVGRVAPHGIVPTNSYTLQADYGELASGWRVQFHATYWGSQFRDESVQAYADSLENTISDPTGDAEVVLGDITVSDIVIGADLRRTYWYGRWFSPYLGGGLATHVVNADGRLIDGTFVERATDVIAVGVAGSAGVTLRFLGHIALEGQARYDFLSLARFASLRVGASYYFDNPASRAQ